jgi:formylglycine-generating enzyme required for sulfatase activity
LPQEWEWQYAAQGTDGRTYPWGSASPFPAASCGPSCSHPTAAYMPVPDTGRDEAPPRDADAHASGASPFGVMDMVGNVWQWTDEYMDEHTRAAGAARRQPLSAAGLPVVLPPGLRVVAA